MIYVNNNLRCVTEIRVLVGIRTLFCSDKIYWQSHDMLSVGHPPANRDKHREVLRKDHKNCWQYITRQGQAESMDYE